MEGTIGAEEEEEEEQKDPQRGLLSGARAETAGQAHWDLYPPRQRNRGAAEKERDRSTSVRCVARIMKW